MSRTPMEAGDDTINFLYAIESASKPNPNAGKWAIRYGREILMMSDHLIEHWPTENRASERLGELFDQGYFTARGPAGEQISYQERMHCGPAKHCGEEYVRVGATSEQPGELIEVARVDPDESDDMFEEDGE